MRLEQGTEIDGFVLGDRLHEGGMAVLWQVSRPDLDAPAVMKVPKLGEGEDPAAIVSFEMEQMIAPRLRGPHVPRFIANGDFARQPYIVMEHLPGATLAASARDVPLVPAEAARLGGLVATALDDLHRQHVIHLDVKPANVMFRTTGEAVLIDFGLAHHDQLPDLMQEEFRLPYGTAPYMAPEQLLGVRTDSRSDIFALGVMLYYLSTGKLPFGSAERLKAMKRRLWRDPEPPRRLDPSYPPWLQEIVLRCLEVQPGRRYPTAAQLAFDLANPDRVKLTMRSERSRRDGLATVIRRRFNSDLTPQTVRRAVASQVDLAPIIAVSVDLDARSDALDAALRTAAQRLAGTLPDARLAFVNVLRLGRITLDTTLDETGQNKHVDRLVALRHWADPLKLPPDRLTVHVIEAIDPAAAVLEFARANRVDHILLGARQSSLGRTILGSVSGKVAAEAPCSVTVVRPPRREQKLEPATAAADAAGT